MKNRNTFLHCEVYESSLGTKKTKRQILFAAWPHVFSTRCTASFLEWALYGIYFVHRRDEDEANTTSTSCAAGAGRCPEILFCSIRFCYQEISHSSSPSLFSLSLSHLVLCNLDSRAAGPIFHWSFMPAFDVYKYGWMTWLHGCLKMLTRWIRRGTIWLVDPSLVWILLCIPRLFSTCAQDVLDDVPTDLMIHCTIPDSKPNHIENISDFIATNRPATSKLSKLDISKQIWSPGCFFQISRSAGSS